MNCDVLKSTVTMAAGNVGAPLSVRNGIAPSRVYMPPGCWPSLLDFLLARFQYMPPGVLRHRLEQGDIVDEAGAPQTPGSPYRPGHWLWYYREVPDETPVPFELPVLFRDDRLVVVDKPHFLASIPAGRHLAETALTRLRASLGLPELCPIHRLDRDTAGVMLFCIDRDSRAAYQTLFQTRQVIKEYEAVAPFRPNLPLPVVYRSRLVENELPFTMREIAGEPNSETRIELIEQQGAVAHYRLWPSTGRKHQLRMHMSALGIPICNDRFYPRMLARQAADDFNRPLQLLARAIEFTDPFDGASRRFESRRRLLGLVIGYNT